MKGYMYILECCDGSYYTGSTKDLDRRLEQHQTGEGANHTKKRLPVKLVYYEEFDRIDTAFYREKQVQGWSRKKKEALINRTVDKLNELAGCKNKSHHSNVAFDSAQATALAVVERSRNNIPKLRFPEFGEGWKEKLYNEIYSFYSTNSFSRDNLNYENGEVKNIHYGDIHTKFSTLFNIENEYVPFINKEINLSKIKEDNYCKVGDLVIADASEDYNDIGKTIEIINLNNIKAIAGLHTFLARPNKLDMALGFSGYMLQSYRVRKQVMMIAQGTKVLGLATGRLGKVELKIPQLPEQQKIASFLTSVDTKIEQLTKKKNLLEQYKKGVMQQIFPSGDGQVPQLRFAFDSAQATKFDSAQATKFDSAQGVKVVERSRNHPDWEEKKYNEIYSFYTTNSFSRDMLNYEQGEIKNIHYGDIHTKFLTLFDIENECVPFINSNIDLSKIRNENYCKEGDLVIADASEDYDDIGKTIEIVKLSGKKVLAGLHTFLARPDKHDMAFGFAGYMLQVWNVRKQIMKIAQGTKVLGLATGRLGNVNLEIPCLEEQTQIANFLSAIDTKIELVNTQLENTQQFKKGLLQQMFV